MATSPPAPEVAIRKLRDDAIVPRYMSEGAAGLDLVAALDEPVVLAPGQRAAIATGLAMAIPDGYEGQVRPRSGLALEHGITVLNAPGTIDADYRGEVKVVLVNLGDRPVQIESGWRIAQLVIAATSQAALRETQALPPSRRGAGGFGSTGQTVRDLPHDPAHGPAHGPEHEQDHGPEMASQRAREADHPGR